jgi:hypothetical protein
MPKRWLLRTSMTLNICMLAGMYYAVHFCTNLPRQKTKSIQGRRDTGRNKAQEGQRTIATGQESSTSTPVPQRLPPNLSTSASKPQNRTTQRAQGPGDYEVLWHDGKLHDRQFNVREAADAFYNTINPDFAHRLSYKGVELKAHIWGPWPAEWIPAPSSPTRGGANAGGSGPRGGAHPIPPFGRRGNATDVQHPVEVTESRHENGVWAIGHGVPHDPKMPAPDHIQKLRLLVLKNDFHVDIKKAGAGASMGELVFFNTVLRGKNSPKYSI